MSALSQREDSLAVETNAERQPTDGRGHFFAIDYRAWHRACDLGLNTAVAYLMLARGTLRDNRTTMWSVNATEGRTGISRPKAKIALEKLIAHGLVENSNNSTTRPKRRLVPGHLLPEFAKRPKGLPKKAADLVAQLPMEASEITRAMKEVLDQPIMSGLARFDGIQYLRVDTSAETPDWIWLPNSLIDGAAGEIPPVENIRRAQDVAALRLFIDLYYVHSLTFWEGVPSTMLWLGHDTKQIAYQHEYRIWNVQETDPEVSRHAPFFQPFWRSANGDLDEATNRFSDALEILMSLGYLHFVCHIFEGDGSEAEIIHAFDPAWQDHLTEAEKRLHYVTREAAIALLPDFLRLKHSEDDMVPIHAHIQHVTAKGVARLLYRPRTQVTSQWMSLWRRWERWAAHYEELVAKLSPGKL